MSLTNLTTTELLNGVWDRDITIRGALETLNPSRNTEQVLAILCAVNSHLTSPTDALNYLRSLYGEAQ